MNVLEDYITKIFSLVKPEEIKPLKIVLDAGNGMGKVSFVEMLKRLPMQVEYIYWNQMVLFQITKLTR